MAETKYKYNASVGYFNKEMLAILKKGEEKNTQAKKTTTNIKKK